MNKKTEQLAKEILAKVCPQGHTQEEVDILVDAFCEIASRIEDRQQELPNGVRWSMRSWIRRGGPVVI